MEDTSKYLIHATVTADGVVERSDVVGAIFGQTEGLLGDELDLRDLRQSQRVGRIDVEISSSGGESQGRIIIATSLDKVETATLAASLETITRVGPCRANLQIDEIEDVRAAKRKEVVERATELLRTGFDDTVMSSEEILAQVRQQVRVENIVEYEGLPAGPRVADSDAIIVVEGRSDVLTLLKYGIKNAIAVEGTNVPEAVAELTRERTVTAFLDGDRGGDLILEELAQVGDVDYLAFAPPDSSVEDLDHHHLFTALRNKVPYDSVQGQDAPREFVAATDGSATPAPPPADAYESIADLEDGSSDVGSDTRDGAQAGTSPISDDVVTDDRHRSAAMTGDPTETAITTDQSSLEDTERVENDGNQVEGESDQVGDEGVERFEGEDGDRAPSASGATERPSIYDHVNAVIRDETERVRLLDDERTVLTEASASDAYETLSAAESVPSSIVLDGILSQRLLDLAADRGVSQVVARSLGQFTKRPTSVRVHAAADVARADPEFE